MEDKPRMQRLEGNDWQEERINNHLKADLEKVLCDLNVCGVRGEYGRCYLEEYKKCPIYMAHKIIKEK